MKNEMITVYIANAQPFAQSILSHIRELIHQACPEVLEKMKWSVPHFDYKGPICSLAAFKEHCAFGFWKEKLMKDPYHLFNRSSTSHFGRITVIADLPSDPILLSYIQEAIELNEQGMKLPKKILVKEKCIIPEFFMNELVKNKEAWAMFQKFSYSKQKEYIVWITEAKQESTRQKRIETAIVWLCEGKSRHWKYQNCC